MSDRPLLTLTMILKDEAHTITRTLASVKPHIDRWCIVDTGSSDGTQGIVRDAMHGVAGELHEAPFIDFATTRNQGLALAGSNSDFLLWLDADDQLEGGAELRSFLLEERTRRASDREAFHVRVEMGDTAFDSTRVVESRAGWRFRGAVHEVLMHPDRPPPAHRIPGVTIRHTVDALAIQRSRARWERDVELLERELERDPDGTRAAFYLGMSYLWLGRNEEAITALGRRAAMGGWAEEVFYAKLSLARAAHRAGRAWSEVLTYYLDAHSAAPHRAEPLYDIALHYDAQKEHALAFLFAHRGYALPRPEKDTLFIDESIYRWALADLVASHAFWIGEMAVGGEAATKALLARPNDPRLQRNLAFYQEKKRASQ